VETAGETPSPRSVLGVTSFDDRYIVAFGGEVRMDVRRNNVFVFLSTII
jgi:hypothetical protein